MLHRIRRLVVVSVVLLGLSACSQAGPSEPAAAVRPVQHAMGTTEVPVDPRRVVVLDTGELDTVLALGVTPVGAVAGTDGAPLPAYLGERTAGIEIVGTPLAPDLEAIAALDPDLILSNKVRNEDLYPQLSAIAPTVLAERPGVAWRENTELAGRALGREDLATQVLAEYRSRTQEVGQRFGDPARTSVSMIRFVGADIRLYGAGSFIGTVLSDAGFARPPTQQVQETFTEVSDEQVGLADGDLLFYAGFGPDGVAGQAETLGGPLWAGIPAVAAGRAHEVSDDLWYLGIGPIAAGLVLDELGRYAPA